MSQGKGKRRIKVTDKENFERKERLRQNFKKAIQLYTKKSLERIKTNQLYINNDLTEAKLDIEERIRIKLKRLLNKRKLSKIKIRQTKSRQKFPKT